MKELKGPYNGGEPGTGSTFDNARVRNLVLLSDNAPGEKALLVKSIVGSVSVAEIPSWLGTKPPVEGDWVQTMNENFDGNTINLKLWNIHSKNCWEKKSHFSKDNVIVKDGKLTLRFEKKTGPHNDDPQDKETGVTDYATGFADTYGKWTQRYGYFECRQKIPRCPGLWPGLWTMPDRGKALGEFWRRENTNKLPTDQGVGGMEIDIVENLTLWGPYRFNSALHWDGYGKEHKSLGTSCNYVAPDKEGFITIGLLWLPGKIVMYANGKEYWHWENPRICDQQSMLILQNIAGGWIKVPIDETMLPADYVIDYIRVWQRKDLATPEDGPKENNGEMSSL